MRFQVPQFIEVEDKIFGPLTIKQFIYLAGGAGLSFVVYALIRNIAIAFVPIVGIMALSAGLAFYRVYNHFPLISIIEAATKYYVGSKLYIWKKEDKPSPTTPKDLVREAKNYAGVTVPKVSGSKLKDLAWSLDIKESIYSKPNQR